MVVVVALVLFKHLTDGLSNHSGTNISIPHNPVGLQAKSALYTGEISSDTHTVKTFSNIKLPNVNRVAQIHWVADNRRVGKQKLVM